MSDEFGSNSDILGDAPECSLAYVGMTGAEVKVDKALSPTSAVQRARWLNELAAALDEALKLALELGLMEMPSDEARELWARLVSARAQVQGLRLARPDDRLEAAASNRTDLPIWWICSEGR